MPNYHPSDTVSIVQFNQIDNFALRYQHFLRIDRPRNNDPKYKVNFQRSADRLESSSMKLVTQLRERQKAQLQQFAQQGIKLYCVNATVDWRLIVGLGGEHVQETNMTLHHIYGIPYIPGSAVKGVLRHWWLEKDFSDKNGKISEEKALKDSVFLSIFGSQEQRGEVRFLDAYPEKVQFATDIMNPHFGDYYSGTKPPTDNQNPVPINFLTVEKTVFRFVFLAKDQDPLEKIEERFEEALELKGVGAKTAVGYGYFRDLKDKTDTITAELKQQQEAAEKQREEKRLASLSPIEQLTEEVKSLTNSQVDEERATEIYNKQLPSLEEDDKQLIARALKAYWQRINKWKDGSDKQRQKVIAVKAILEEN